MTDQSVMLINDWLASIIVSSIDIIVFEHECDIGSIDCEHCRRNPANRWSKLVRYITYPRQPEISVAISR
jgi:hypothetical protein